MALIEEYNSILTKDEEQKQFLLQVVEDHRERFPDSAQEYSSGGTMALLIFLVKTTEAIIHWQTLYCAAMLLE